MRTFFRANEGHISIADAKKAIREYSPPGDWVNIFIGVNGIEELPDGRIKVEKTTESRYGHFLDESFPETCKELGVEPRYMFNPTRRGYSGVKDDPVYVLLHEDFVKVAKRYEVLVGVGQVELQPAIQSTTHGAANDAQDGQSWSIGPIKRYSGYRGALERALRAAKSAGRPCPTAVEIMNQWRENRPAEIHKILAKSFEYYTAEGSIRECTQKALNQAINELVIRPA